MDNILNGSYSFLSFSYLIIQAFFLGHVYLKTSVLSNYFHWIQYLFFFINELMSILLKENIGHHSIFLKIIQDSKLNVQVRLGKFYLKMVFKYFLGLISLIILFFMTRMAEASRDSGLLHHRERLSLGRHLEPSQAQPPTPSCHIMSDWNRQDSTPPNASLFWDT